MFFSRNNKIQTKIDSPRPPVPRLAQSGIKENPLSKHLRQLDNLAIKQPPAQNVGIYITTNESGTSDIAEQLTKTPPVAQSCHIGFSGWHNLDIMALRRSSRGIICDINPENALFLHNTLEILRKSNNRKEFIQKMVNYATTCDGDTIRSMNRQAGYPQLGLTFSVTFSPNVNSSLVNVFTPVEEIKNHLNISTGWLANEDRFQYIKYLAMTDNIALITENITETKTFIKMRQLLQDNGVQIDSLYTSNIGEYMNTDENKRAFEKTVEALSESDTFIIDARKGYYRNTSDELIQKVISPKSLKAADHAKRWWWGQETMAEYMLRNISEDLTAARSPKP